MRRFVAAVLAIIVSVTLAAGVQAQQLSWPTTSAADSLAVRLGLKQIVRPFPFEFRTLTPREPFLRQSFDSWVKEWHTTASNRLDQRLRDWYRPPVVSTLR